MLNLRKIMQVAIVLAASVILGYGIADAQHNHNHGAASAEPAATADSQSMPHNMSMANRPVQTAIVNGLKVSLDVMDMSMHVHMQGMKENPVPATYDSKQSQAIMVMIKSVASEKSIKDTTVTITIISPAGTKASSPAPWYGDHYGLAFSPVEKGTYRILVDVKGKTGKGHAAFEYKYKA